jgi:arabinogalactan endo-1,4-beta-galactosidase
MAKKLGLPFNPELGVFNHYGDVLSQPAPDFSQYPEIYVPGPWMSLTLDQMKLVLIQYGALVALHIKATGVTVNVWDIGNEINFGFAGVALGNAPNNVDPAIGQQPDLVSVLSMPDGGLSWLKTHMWNYEAQLMRAVQIGILSVYPNAKFSTHIATIPFSTVYTNAFYATMLQHGAQIDVAGYSFYPTQYFDPADMMAFIKSVVTDTVTSFNRPVFFAEQGYPAHQITAGNFINWNYVTPGYPFTEQGQAALLRDITAWGKTRGLSGIRPWAPDDVGLDWEPFAHFKITSGKTATARPVLDAIKQGLAQ